MTLCSAPGCNRTLGRRNTSGLCLKHRIADQNTDPAFNPLAALSAAERADYDVLRRKGGLRREEALRRIGRADLLPHHDG